MNKSSIRKIVLGELENSLLELGFEADLKDNLFKKENESGFYRISFEIKDYNPLFKLEFGLALRLDEVVRFYNPLGFRNPDYFNETVCLTCSMQELTGQEKEYEIWGAEQITETCKDFLELLTQYGLGWFEKYSNINAIDEELNKNDHPHHLYMNDRSRVFYGVIVAAINKNPELSYWVEKYREQIKTFNSPIYEQRYNILLSDLKKEGYLA